MREVTDALEVFIRELELLLLIPLKISEHDLVITFIVAIDLVILQSEIQVNPVIGSINAEFKIL